MSAPDVAVIIVNYRTADMSIAAAESVLTRAPDGLQVEVHLVDNASPGNDREVLLAASQRWGDAVTLHLEDSNHGFGRGNNVVLRQLAARKDAPAKVYLLNPDARLVTNAVAQMSAFLDAHPRAAMVGSAILHDRSLEPAVCAFRFPGVLSEFVEAVNFGPLTRLFDHHLVGYPAELPLQQVDWVSGASMMGRLDALAQVDFFDPDFFLYYEEVEMMHRLKSRGWEIWHLPDAKVAHISGASTGVTGEENRRRPLPGYWYDSWRMYFEKCSGRSGARLTAFARLIGTVIGDTLARLRRKPSETPGNFVKDFTRNVLSPLLGRSGAGTGTAQ
jgi:N-acetylglucosaminyl-diphospho-decaprenol L-rhamnosyltransferase